MLRYHLLALVILITGSCTYAFEHILQVTPIKKVTTSNENLLEGDVVEFKVIESTLPEKIKKGDIVSGYITYYEPNGFAGKEAILHIEQFQTSNGYKLNGMIFAKGNQHNQIMEFKETLGIPALWMRGGEVNLIPKKDVFLLYPEK